MADPAGSYPSLFGNIAWLKKYPYAPPNILSAVILFCAMLGVFFGLKEVRNPALNSHKSLLTFPRH